MYAPKKSFKCEKLSYGFLSYKISVELPFLGSPGFFYGMGLGALISINRNRVQSRHSAICYKHLSQQAA